MMGRDFAAEENLPKGPRAIVVSYAFWQKRRGGRADVLAQSIEVSGVRGRSSASRHPGSVFQQGTSVGAGRQ